MPGLKLRILFILSVSLLVFSSSGKEEEGVTPDGVSIGERFHAGISSRKLDAVTQDYDYGGPNKKHDQNKGKPVIGGKGP